MINLTIRQLEYFRAVVETGSATAAARECHVSQAGLSAGIAQLERTLGVELFVRQKSRSLGLTPAGRAMREKIWTVLDQLQELQMGAKSFGQEIGGTLRLGCFDTLSPMMIPALARYLLTEHPNIRMRFFEGEPTKIEEDLRAGKVEGIVVYTEHVSQDLEHHFLGSHPLYIALPPSHELVEKDTISLKDLTSFPYVLLDQEPIATLIVNSLRRNGVTSDPILTSRNIDTVRSFVADGIGFAITGVRPPRDTSFDGRPIIYRPIEGGSISRDIVLCTNANTHLSQRLRVSMDFFRNLLQEAQL